jgi:hypothetical protein
MQSPYNESFPNLKASFSTAVAQLDAQPVTLRVHPLTGGDQIYTVRVDGQGFVSAVYFTIYSSPFLPLAPALIDSAAQGQYAALSVPYSFNFSVTSGLSTGMLISVNCSDEYGFTSEADIEATNRQILPNYRLIARHSMMTLAVHARSGAFRYRLTLRTSRLLAIFRP